MFATDLDRTLIRTDLLWETFFHGLATSPLATLAALAALRRGRAALKAALAGLPFDVGLLPLNDGVVEALGAARAAGERTLLVSASDARLVRAVADRVGLFDEVHGSDGTVNLKGAAKARLLAGLAAERGEALTYLGDSAADLPVWRAAACAVTVGAPPALRRAAEAAAPEAIHLEPAPGWPARVLTRAHLRALRPHQWLKNLLVFLPVLAAHRTDAATWGAAFAAFLAFSLAASSVYVLNDLLDLAADRAHPRKRLRPFAAGTVPLVHGAAMAPLLLLAAVLVALPALPPLFLAVLGLYTAVTLAYSLALKRRLVIDICTLAGLYTLRVMAGAAATAVPLSPWMLAFSGFLFLALAAMKRQAELVDGLARGRERASGRAYEAGDLPVVTMMALAAGYIAVLVLALYASSPEVTVLYGTPLALWGACPVLLYWVSRLVMISHRGRMTDDPIVFAVRDPVSVACGAAILGLAAAAALA